MSDGVEGVGEAVTGGMAARAVEPHAGEASAADEGHCLNCGTTLMGSYCHRCGQRGHVHRTITAFFHDVMHSVLHLDGKLWRTLPLLAWRPGELTRRYVEGERAKFVSPLALFLFSVFLMFAVLSIVGGPFEVDTGGVTTTEEDRAEAQREFDRETAETRRELERLRAERQRRLAAGEPTQEVDIGIRSAERELALEQRLFRQAMAIADAQEQREAQRAARQAEGGAEKAADDGNDGPIGIDTGWPTLDAAIDKANDNPSLLFYKIQANAYKFSWALIPISVPFVWLLFLHRRRYRQIRAYHHVVFVTYSIAFMSLGFIALSLLRPLGTGDTLAGLAIAFIPPIHMYRQLRGGYQLSRFSALWRTAALLIFASIAATLFLLLLVALGAFS